jgi:hypothetical protein
LKDPAILILDEANVRRSRSLKPKPPFNDRYDKLLLKTAPSLR